MKTFRDNFVSSPQFKHLSTIDTEKKHRETVTKKVTKTVKHSIILCVQTVLHKIHSMETFPFARTNNESSPQFKHLSIIDTEKPPQRKLKKQLSIP